MAEIKLTKLEQQFIDQSWNYCGFLDDSEVDFHHEALEVVCNDDNFRLNNRSYRIFKQHIRETQDRIFGAVKASLEKKGIIFLEAHRTKSEGGDLWAISQEYDYLFEEC